MQALYSDYHGVSPDYLSTETSWEVLKLPEVGSPALQADSLPTEL